MVVEKIVLKITSALAVMVVCFALGCSYADSRNQDKQIDELTQAQADSKDEVLKSQNESIAIEGRVSESTQRVESINKEAVKRVESNEPKVITKVVTKYIGIENDSSSNDGFNQSPNGEVVVETVRPWTFDSGTIRLLNSARLGVDTDSTASSVDASDQTTSSIGISEFVANDLDVVALYHEQSIRYKALQDYVTEKQNEGFELCKPR